MSLDGLPAGYLSVLLDGLGVFEQHGLLLAGGYAFRAHEILQRPSQDLDFATASHEPLPICMPSQMPSPTQISRISPAVHDPDLDLGTILDHLAGVSVFPDEDFAEYGLDAPAIASLRRWTTGWYDLARRLASEDMDDETFDGS